MYAEHKRLQILSSCRESLGHKDLPDIPDQMDPLYAMHNYNIQ
jgi:hypothetical protein